MRAGTLLLTLLLAAAPPMRSFPIEGVGTLSLPLPDAWRAEAGKNGTLKFHAPTGELFLLTVMVDRTGADSVDPARVRDLVEKQARVQLDGAVETRVELVELRGAVSTGYYFSFTDRELVDQEPKPGQFRVMNQGVLAAGDRQILYFTVLSQKKDSPGVKEALAALREARIGPAL